MKIRKHLSLSLALAAASLVATPRCAEAVLTDFTDYGLSSINASWDIFYGANYLPVFSFASGTAGNPILNTLDTVSLRATVTTWTAGPPMPSNQQATGPIGTDNMIPGDREQFYTFFGNVAWDITDTTDALWNSFVFQAKVSTGSNTSLSNVLFNGLTATSSSFNETTSVGTWRWDSLNLASGSNYALTWATGTHTGIDAYQIQAGVIPEPSVYALLTLTAGFLLFRKLRRRAH